MKKRNVGAGPVSAQQKGITLIALIITIIVMLILVGVTVSFTIGEDGIIAQARQAKIEQEKATEKEQLIVEAYATYGKEAKFNRTKFRESVETLGYQYDTTSGEITTPKGYTFYADAEGKIIESNPWIERGLNANFVLGKWYYFLTSEEDEIPWFMFKEDGGYAQIAEWHSDSEYIINEYTSEEIDNYKEAGAFEITSTEFIAVGQWKVSLNEDGTFTFHRGDGSQIPIYTK